MKKVFLFLTALVAFTLSAQAQEDKYMFNHLAVGVNVGTAGAGVDLAMPICDYVTVRAGVNYVPKITVKDIGVDVSGQQAEWAAYQATYKLMQTYKSYLDAAGQKAVDEVGNYMNEPLPSEVLIDGELDMMTYSLLFDVYPSKKSTFHLTLGFYSGKDKIVEAFTTNCESQLNAITYYNENLANKTFTANVPVLGPQSFTFGKEVGAEVGDYLIKPYGKQANALIKVNGFRPYFGIGFGNIVPKKHKVTFGFDLGCQYWGSPSVYIKQKEGDVKLDKDTEVDGDGGALKLISKFSIYPTLNFRLGFRAF